MQYRIGIDVGGTNTDGAVLDSQGRVVASAKTPTTPDVTSGVRLTLETVLERSAVDRSAVQLAMLSTTHCTNALTTRSGLVRVGVLRLGAPATTAVPPLVQWPEDLRAHVLAASFILPGGHEFNGEELSPIDLPAVRRAARELKGKVDAVAISAVFSLVNPAHEQLAREVVLEELGADIPVTLSSEIGSLGLLERESASALNAALTAVAGRAVRGFEEAVRAAGLSSQLYLGQNDGTLMSLDQALRFPVLTIASGPANSFRGATYLSGLRDAIVVDIGGTTTDLGVVSRGFPRESAAAVDIAGVRTNFRMPDLISLGLGGGSLVRGALVGPESVGYRLVEQALVFGGDQCTTTDLAVAAGLADIGDRARVRHLSPEFVNQGIREITRMLEDAIDRIKLAAEDVPVIVVGGGSILFPEKIAGASEIVKPPHFDVANAVGVAIAEVSSTVDQIFTLANRRREEVLEEAQQRAIQQVIALGAAAESVELLEVEELMLAYMPGDARRIRVKAAGRLAFT